MVRRAVSISASETFTEPPAPPKLFAIFDDTVERPHYNPKSIMTDSGPGTSGAGTSGTSASGTGAGTSRIDLTLDIKAHAYDPAANPELFEGVVARRVIAFAIDLIIVATPLIAASVFIFVLGVITFGLGWALYWLLSPASVIWALVYYGFTLGSPASATLGMRVME